MVGSFIGKHRSPCVAMPQWAAMPGCCRGLTWLQLFKVRGLVCKFPVCTLKALHLPAFVGFMLLSHCRPDKPPNPKFESGSTAIRCWKSVFLAARMPCSRALKPETYNIQAPNPLLSDSFGVLVQSCVAFAETTQSLQHRTRPDITSHKPKRN